MRRALLGAPAGVLLALALPPFGLWPLALCGAALLAWSCGMRTARQRLVVGLLAGLAQFGIGLAWTSSFTIAGCAALIVFEALFLAAACLCTPAGRGRVPAFIGLVTLGEAARDAWPFGGLPLGGIALGEVGGPLLNVARLGGPLCMVAVTLLLGAGIAGLWSRATRAAGMLCVLLGIALVVAGVFAPDGGPPLGRVRAAVVQEGGKRGLDSLEVSGASVLRSVLATTRSLRAGEVQLVVWPEDVVELAGPIATAPAIVNLRRLARRLRVTLLAGVTAPVGTTLFDNEILAFSPAGRIVARFEKVHPVPFGEYVPFRSLVAHFANLSDIPRDAVRGRGSGMVETPAGRLALLVSFETFFTGRGRSGVNAGGRLLVVSTNTASYATSQVPAQELAASRIQAVSEGRTLLQSATTGVSAVIGPRGTVLSRTGLGDRTVLLVDATLRGGATLYDDTGSWPILAAALLLSGYGLCASSLERRRARARLSVSPRPDR